MEYIKEYTNSHIYIRPMIGYDYRFYSKNCYNTHVDKDFNIYIIYNKLELDKYTENRYNENIINLKNNVYNYSYKENDIFTIIRFKVPDEYKEDFYNFLDSRYTLFTNNYKTRLRRFYISTSSILESVNKAISPSKRDIKELSDKFDVDPSYIIEIKSKLKLSLEIYQEEYYEPNGYIYEYYNKEQLNKQKL